MHPTPVMIYEGRSAAQVHELLADTLPSSVHYYRFNPSLPHKVSARTESMHRQNEYRLDRAAGIDNQIDGRRASSAVQVSMDETAPEQLALLRAIGIESAAVSEEMAELASMLRDD